MDVLSDLNNIILQCMELKIQQEHRDEVDPYGNPWKPKQRDNGKKILVDTGALTSSYQYFSDPNPTIINNVEYFAEATTPRPVFPDSIPDDLNESINTQMKDYLIQNMKDILLGK